MQDQTERGRLIASLWDSLQGEYRAETVVAIPIFLGVMCVLGPPFLGRAGSFLALFTVPVGFALIVLGLVVGLLYAFGVAPTWMGRWRTRGEILNRYAFDRETGEVVFRPNPPGPGWRLYVRAEFPCGKRAELKVNRLQHSEMKVGSIWDFKTVARRVVEARKRP